MEQNQIQVTQPGAMEECNAIVKQQVNATITNLQAIFWENGITDSKDALMHIINNYEVMAKSIIENNMYDEGLRQVVEKTYTQNKVMVGLIEVLNPWKYIYPGHGYLLAYKFK